MIRNSHTPKLILCIYSVLLCNTINADVLNASSHGFSTENIVVVSAKAKPVYKSLVKDINRWWSSNHTFSGNADNLYIQAKPQGCFCEKLKGRPAIRHMTVIYIEPNKLLRMQGGLGPLQEMAVTGTMTWSLIEQEDKTQIKLSYNVGGYYPGGLDKQANAVDSVINEQLLNIKKFIEAKNNH